MTEQEHIATAAASLDDEMAKPIRRKYEKKIHSVDMETQRILNKAKAIGVPWKGRETKKIEADIIEAEAAVRAVVSN